MARIWQIQISMDIILQGPPSDFCQAIFVAAAANFFFQKFGQRILLISTIIMWVLQQQSFQSLAKNQARLELEFKYLFENLCGGLT